MIWRKLAIVKSWTVVACNCLAGTAVAHRKISLIAQVKYVARDDWEIRKKRAVIVKRKEYEANLIVKPEKPGRHVKQNVVLNLVSNYDYLSD